MKLLLWDIDLTLVKTGGAGLRGLDRAFRDVFGWQNAMDQVRPQGKTDRAIIREVCVRHGMDGDGDVSAAVEAVLERYVGHLAHEVGVSGGYEILPGILEILDDLGGRDDVALGLATGNIEEGAWIKLERGGLNAYFAFGGFGGISENRVEVVREAARQAARWRGSDFSPDETWVIGDTPHDVNAGREAGFRTVAVATGSFSIGELETTGADLVIEDLRKGRDQFMGSTRIA